MDFKNFGCGLGIKKGVEERDIPAAMVRGNEVFNCEVRELEEVRVGGWFKTFNGGNPRGAPNVNRGTRGN